MTRSSRGGDDPRRPRHRGTAAAGPPVWRRPAERLTKILAALVSATLLLGFGYGWWNYRDLNRNLHRLEVFTPQARTGPDIDGSDQNILLVGNDDRTKMTAAEVRQLKVGRDGGSLNTDTMLIVHVPADGKKATLISLPRDAYVAIPGYGMNKLNSAYATGYTHGSGSPDAKRAAGMQLLIRTAQNLTGLHIDHFVQVSLVGFVRISDAIGGVTVNLCHAVDDTRAHNIAHGIPGGSGLKLSAGEHTISGVTALEFVRQREQLPNSDLDRERRQRYFLAAAFRKISSAGVLLHPSRLHSLISAIDRSVYVDKTLDILQLATQLSALSADNIQGDNIPFVRFDTVPGVGSVEIVDPAQVQRWVADLLGRGQDELGRVAPADPATVTVRVLNGGTVNGAAGVNATRLRGYGFTAGKGNHDPVRTTTVEYADGMQAAVKALLRYLPDNVVLQRSDVATLTLILGRDGLAVRRPGTHSQHPGSSGSSGSSGSASPGPSRTPAPIDSGCIN